MLLEAVHAFCRDLEGFCKLNKEPIPPFSWVLVTALNVLKLFPSGITRAVLLTELEARWYASLYRGESEGQLKQALMGTDSGGDMTAVLSGTVHHAGDSHFTFSQDGTSCGCILHGQLQDFAAFCDYYGQALWPRGTTGPGRLCRFARCRFLRAGMHRKTRNTAGAILLPTQLALPILDVRCAPDATIVNGTMLQVSGMHSPFAICLFLHLKTFALLT